MRRSADWLQNLGLGQYAQRFVENDIDIAVLADLTDQDLEKIGVTSLGHRRKLLRAIVDLNRVEDEAASISSPAAPVAPHDAAERRQVTVMKPRSRASSSTTITGATTKAYRT
jgi:SAM domain (Sterile alpha motif)